MTVHTDYSFGDIRYICPDVGYQSAVLLGYCIAGCIRDIQSCCPGVDDRFEYLIEKLAVGSAGIFGVKLDVVGIFERAFDSLYRHLDDIGFLLAHRPAVLSTAELALNMDVRDTDAGMDSAAFGLGDGLAADIDILGPGAGQAADSDRPDFLAY